MSRAQLGLILVLLFPLTIGVNSSWANGDGDAYASEVGGLGLGARYSNVNNRDTDESTHMGGVMLRARSEFLGIEGGVDYRNEDLFGDVDLKSWPVSASLLVFPIRPIYALAGLGWYNTSIDFPENSLFDDETDSRLGYHFGAGVEVPIAPTVRLTGDARWQFVDYEFENIPESIGNVDADAFTLNAGILFYMR